MKMTILSLAGAMALAGAASFSPAFGQSAPPAGPITQFVAQQPDGQWLARTFLGQAVQSPNGEAVGDIVDLIFARNGQINSVVLGVGGFLSIGEKYVGVPYGSLKFSTSKDGARVVVLAIDKEALMKAPEFKAVEKTTYEKIKEKASDLSHKAAEKAIELKDQAAKKIDDMKKSDTTKP